MGGFPQAIYECARDARFVKGLISVITLVSLDQLYAHPEREFIENL